MDITSYIASQRSEALSTGDYGSYRKQMSKRLLKLRRKLGRTTPKGKEYVTKTTITAEEVSSKPEYEPLQFVPSYSLLCNRFGRLLLLASERAWAHAMQMKSTHAADSSEQGITGSTKTHIISRIEKARKKAAHLQSLVKPASSSEHVGNDYLEASAYTLLLLGSLRFESRKWLDCLTAYSQVYLIYTALSTSSSQNSAENSRSLLSTYVEPSMRYAAYQSELPRSLSIPRIASQFLPQDAEILNYIPSKALDVLKEQEPGASSQPNRDDISHPSSITWRSRTVNLEHADIAQALANVAAAEKQMASQFFSNQDMTAKARAAAYDDVLVPSQDAVDATKNAISELEAEGAQVSDSRMQALYVTWTAVNYAMIGWRIGRNRVLCGDKDGALSGVSGHKTSKKRKSSDEASKQQPESKAASIKRLRECVVLYDGILQSLESIKDLQGVAADETLVHEVDSRIAYFSALR